MVPVFWSFQEFQRSYYQIEKLIENLTDSEIQEQSEEYQAIETLVRRKLKPQMGPKSARKSITQFCSSWWGIEHRENLSHTQYSAVPDCLIFKLKAVKFSSLIQWGSEYRQGLNTEHWNTKCFGISGINDFRRKPYMVGTYPTRKKRAKRMPDATVETTLTHFKTVSHHHPTLDAH